MHETVLREIAHGEPGRLDDLTGIRLFETRQHLQKSRLASAVRPAEADTFTVVNLPAHRPEQHAIAERFREGGKLDHDGCSPSALDAAARTRGTLNGFVR